MDHRAFGFATIGQCIKRKQCLHIAIMFSKQSSLFSFYALPSGGKSKDAVVHSLPSIPLHTNRAWK